MATDILIAAYHAARDDYEAVKSGSRAEMFTKFLVAERVLSVRLGSVDPSMEHFLSRHVCAAHRDACVQYRI
jgi:hypothetical protein